MNRKIWLSAGIAGMLCGVPYANVNAAVNVQISTGHSPSFIIN